MLVCCMVSLFLCTPAKFSDWQGLVGSGRSEVRVRSLGLIVLMR